MRPYWKGYLKLALVSCPIALHAACSTAERIAFRQINKATGNRLRQQLIDEETHEPVAPEHKARGYEVAKGQYLIIEDAELEAVDLDGVGALDLDRFELRIRDDEVLALGHLVATGFVFRGNRRAGLFINELIRMN